MNKANPFQSFELDQRHKTTFDALITNPGDFGLVACRIGDERSACICQGRIVDAGIRITPLFVAVTPGLDLVFPGIRVTDPARD